MRKGINYLVKKLEDPRMTKNQKLNKVLHTFIIIVIESKKIRIIKKNEPTFDLIEKNRISDAVLNEENIVNIEKKPEFDIICPICLGVLRKPVTCGNVNDNPFCTVCINENLKRCKNCPSCKLRFKGTTNRYLIGALNSLVFRCPLECGENLSYKENYSGIEKHIRKECKNNITYKCSLCTKLLAIPDKHKELCSELRFECTGCKENLLAQDKDNHIEICPKRIIQCSKCRLGYPYDLKNSHDEYYCENTSYLMEILYE